MKFWSVSNVHEDWQIQQWRDESGRVSFERITRKNAGDFISFAVIHHDFMCMQYHVLIGSGLCTCKLYIIKFCALCKPYWLFFAVLCVRVCVCFGACLHQVVSNFVQSGHKMPLINHYIGLGGETVYSLCCESRDVSLMFPWMFSHQANDGSQTTWPLVQQLVPSILFLTNRKCVLRELGIQGKCTWFWNQLILCRISS